MGKVTWAAILLLLLSSFGCISPDAGTAPRGLWVWGWEYLAGVALAITVMLLALGYMASVLLGDEKMRAWVKKEVGQTVLSLLILVLAIALVGVLDQWLKTVSYITEEPTGKWSAYVNTVCCTSGVGGCTLERKRACHIELATDFLHMLYETARMNAIACLNNYWTYGFLSNLSVSATSLLDDKQGNLNFAPFAGLAVPADFFSVLFEMSVKIMMLIRAQQVFLDYVWYAFFPVMMSMGLILRIFYFTRKLGGLLIALALATYVVFPMFYVVADAVLFGFMDPASWTAQGGAPFGMVHNSDPATGGTALPITDPNQPVNYGASDEGKMIFEPGQGVNIDLCNDPAASQQQNEMLGLADGFASAWKQYEGSRWYEDFLNFVKTDPAINPLGAFGPKGPIAVLATVMVFSVLVPFIGLMTTLAAVKYLSPLIGGDVEISVLSRLI